MRSRIFLLLINLISCLCLARGGETEYNHLPDFAVPKQFFTSHDFNPVGYLATYPIKDVDEKLSTGSLTQLKSLFVDAARASKIKFDQDFPLDTKAPIYKLLKKQYPELAKREQEGGGVIFLGEIADFLLKR